MSESIGALGDCCTEYQEILFEFVLDALTPPTLEEWENTPLKVALLAHRILRVGLFCVLEPIVGALALAGAVISRLAAPNKTGFQAVLADQNLWNTLDLSQKTYPRLMGVAISEYQYSGMENCPHNQWAPFEKDHLSEANQSKTATDLWNRMDEHIARLKELGVDSFRFSIEWSQIEPEKGKFNEAAIQHYVEFTRKLKDAGITPMACLLHFTIPQWMEEQGGILNPEFPKHMTEFVEKVFPYLSDEITLWNTINEPGVQAFMGYLLGEFPPNHHSLAEMGKGLKHLMQAHCAVYEVMKNYNPDAQIGLVHQILRFQAYRWWHPIERITAYFMTKINFAVVADFLRTGVFDFKVPFLAHERFTVENVPNDFTGVNYYVRPLLKQEFSKEFIVSGHYPGEMMTKMPFREDPAGLYEAIRAIDGPVYVTENGISAQNDEQMARYYNRALYAVSEAIKEGADVRGYYAWSLSKNAEWAEGWDPQNFGLYDYDRETETFSLRPGAKAYMDEVQAAHQQHGGAYSASA